MKKKIIGVLAMSLMLTSSISSFAASSTVSKAFVDSNTWTSVTSATKSSTTDKASVLISTIYDSNKSAADNYKQVRLQIGSTGNQAPEITATKGTTKDFNLVAEAKAKGTVLKFYGMGNDPALDCYIDATFNAN